MGRARRQHGPVEGEQLGPGFRPPGSRHPNWEAASDGRGPGPQDGASVQSTFEKGACAWRAPHAHHPARLRSGLGEAEQRAEKLDTPHPPCHLPQGRLGLQDSVTPPGHRAGPSAEHSPQPLPRALGSAEPPGPSSRLPLRAVLPRVGTTSASAQGPGCKPPAISSQGQEAGGCGPQVASGLL